MLLYCILTVFSVFSVSCELLLEDTPNHTPRDYTFVGAYESSVLFVGELPRVEVPQWLGQGRYSGAGDLLGLGVGDGLAPEDGVEEQPGAGELPGLGVGDGLAPEDVVEEQPKFGLAALAAGLVVRLSVPQFLHLVDKHPVDQHPGEFPFLDQCGVDVVELQSPKVGDLGFRFSSNLCRGA